MALFSRPSRKTTEQGHTEGTARDVKVVGRNEWRLLGGALWRRESETQSPPKLGYPQLQAPKLV
jgi:hypothetical protein